MNARTICIYAMYTFHIRICASLLRLKLSVIGNICMDACMIDVTDTDAHEGDSVIIFGEELPVSELSDKLKTIPYEILTSISPRVKRVYYRE